MNLEDIRKVKIPKKVIHQSFQFFKKNGLNEVESHCLWVGTQKGDMFLIKEIIVPEQINHGFYFIVTNLELDRINRELYKRKLRLIAQVHTHPCSAFHSDTDDDFPIMTTNGGFSIVIPEYGLIDKIDITDIAIFRLRNNEWIELSKDEKMEIFSGLGE